MTAPVAPQVVVGIDVGSTQCSVCLLRPDKTVLRKPHEFANSAPGFAALHTTLTTLALPPAAIPIGLEATGPYWENLYYFLLPLGYTLVVLHPGQTHLYSQQRGLRAKTDRVDALTIARLLLSDDVRPVYVPSEQIVTYRELTRLQAALTTQIAHYKVQIHDALQPLFPEFTQVFADPSGVTALALLTAYPSAAAIRAAGVAGVLTELRRPKHHRYGRATAEALVRLAEGSVGSGVARAARETGLRIAAEQVQRTQAQLAQVEAELTALRQADPGAGSLQTVPEFGAGTVAVLRAELGEVTRFSRGDQAVAYVGLDIRVRQSGKWKGQAKLSKRGSGRVRQLLYMAAVRSLREPGSAFAAYYRAQVAAGCSSMSALMGVMRKMLLVAYRLLKSGGHYEPARVGAGAAAPRAPQSETSVAAPAAA
jgi:transposase